MRIGLISDTHGLMRPEALDALRGSDHILHAGDIGDPSILSALEALAPVTAVRGNNDTAAWAHGLQATCLVTFGDVTVYMLHDLKELSKRPPGVAVHVVVAGHSHRPSVSRRDSVLLVNPGSAGRRRFSLPVSVGELTIDGKHVDARILTLPIGA